MADLPKGMDVAQCLSGCPKKGHYHTKMAQNYPSLGQLENHMDALCINQPHVHGSASSWGSITERNQITMHQFEKKSFTNPPIFNSDIQNSVFFCFICMKIRLN